MNPPFPKVSFSILLLFIVVTGCSVQKPFYGTKEKDWTSRTLPGQNVKYTVYLISGFGDEADSTEQVFSMLENLVHENDTSHAMVFLSDHIYKGGVPDNPAARERAEQILDNKLSFLARDKGKVLFVAGTHDIEGKKKRKLATIERSHDYVEKKIGRNHIFFPEDECPGPGLVAFTDDWVAVPINTLWWLEEKKEKNTDCEHKKPSNWQDEIKDVLDNNQRRNILVLGHHPLINLGHHGGYYSLRQHIFPFTDAVPWLYIPLPVIGSLYPIYRAGIGTPQDLAYPPYKQMRHNLFAAFKGFDNVMYASGHEHSLQYIKYNKQDFIITNASVRTDWVAKRNLVGFTYSHNGLVRLTLLQNGELWMDVLVPDAADPAGKVVFRKRLKDNSYKKPNDSTAVTSSASLDDSTVTVAANEHLEAGSFKSFFLGKHYREAWTTPVEVPVMDLSTEEGGLSIVKKGGGFQTQSLQLRNTKGEEFGLRSVTKYTERILGPSMQNTFAADIVRDQNSTTNPYAPLVVDALSDRAGVYHSDAKIVFIPNDPRLAEYRKDFANTLALFEQRANGPLQPSPNFGYVKETVSTMQMLKAMHKDNAVRHDERQLLRSRLFDMWINDWDRHEDQWRWGVVPCDEEHAGACSEMGIKKQFYVPLPKDRDQAFARFDGVLPWFAGRKWALRKFQDFDTDVRDVPGLNFNARNLDHALLTELPETEWLRIAGELQKELSDEAIDSAVRRLPAPLYQVEGTRIANVLKARRGKLPSIARRYYAYLSRAVDITGSDKREIFDVERSNDDSTVVNVRDAESGRMFYHRTFFTRETDEIRLYGFGGDDVFNVTGHVHKSILVRIVGGAGRDSIVDHSEVGGWGKKTVVYDTEKDNVLEGGSETKDRTSSSKTINDYDFDANEYNLVAPATFFGYNIDDGLFLGGGIVIKHQGFRKKPYANYQRLVVNTALNELILNFKYTGDFNNVMGNWGIFTEVTVLAPNNTTNFYGLGNDTHPVGDVASLYYRVRYDEVRVFPAVKRHIGKYQFIKAGPLYDYVKIEKTPDNFISSPEAAAYITDFTGRHFAGGRLEYEVQHIDDSVLTLRGLRWAMAVNALHELHGSLAPVNLQAEGDAYIPMPNHSTLALRAGAAHILGDYEFYLANTLGEQDQERRSGNLRGYQRGRFAGRSAVYFNGDFRLHLLSFRTYLFPAHFGVLGFYDAARVWSDGEVSHTWHTGYGWGIWLVPFGKAVINLTFATSKEQKLTTLNIGFLF